ncbi:hypothetical protein APHAL10511_000951 [Amanita phalloides]|nr:hypothetical protein APHAL10511_000951 [Amanita phalloides]
MKSTNGAPRPAGKLAAYVLYAVSIITTPFMLGLYLVRPYFRGRRKGGKLPWENPLLNSMVVLPVQSLPGGKDEKKKKKGKKGDGKNAINLG